MAIIQYPYRLKICKETEAVFDQNTGDWIPGTAEWVDIGQCRDEINGSGARVTTQDGENYVYSAVIYAPLSTPFIGNGSKVEVWDGDFKRMSGNVVRFGRGQLNVRIWV
ncbi:hypothetical protein H0S70_07190 [Chryseobacterium manosquense]|uniref:Uncharacterized protein n=1 Tax=Chryseobacterium manosquense TaxID=2754694 RepID=A0A7H1DT82_9FLAO|nr:hypothetical protein [Chryseobacterium manosquense]QNS40190.1 hypothetical protein H0S70_07190 [Chryseobacterium manosquense]